jgi:sugar phosphate permease
MNEAEVAHSPGDDAWWHRLGGWRVAMSFPAACGLVYALVLVLFVPNAPDSPKGTTPKSKRKPAGARGAGLVNGAAANDGVGVGSVLKEVVSSSVVWKLSVCYLGIGIVRDFYSNWGPNFLEEA